MIIRRTAKSTPKKLRWQRGRGGLSMDFFSLMHAHAPGQCACSRRQHVLDPHRAPDKFRVQPTSTAKIPVKHCAAWTLATLEFVHADMRRRPRIIRCDDHLPSCRHSVWGTVRDDRGSVAHVVGLRGAVGVSDEAVRRQACPSVEQFVSRCGTDCPGAMLSRSEVAVRASPPLSRPLTNYCLTGNTSMRRFAMKCQAPNRCRCSLQQWPSDRRSSARRPRFTGRWCLSVVGFRLCSVSEKPRASAASSALCKHFRGVGRVLRSPSHQSYAKLQFFDRR